MPKLKTSVLFLIFCISTIELFAQVDTAWVRRYNGPGNGNDGASALALDGSGNVYVTGYSYGSGTGYDYATIKYSSAGDTVWVRRYNGPVNDFDWAYALAVDGSGNVYVTGGSYGGGTSGDYATIKYSSAGDTVWVRRYNGPGNGADYARALAIDGSGNVYVTGFSYGTSRDYATLKYSPAGDTVWVRRYNGPGNSEEEAYSLAVDGSGNVYVTGWSIGSGTSIDYATIKYSSSGDTIWVRRYNGPGNGDDYARALAIDGSGNVYVTGLSYGGGTNYDYATIKYAPNGDTFWVRRYNGPGDGYDYAFALALDGSGNLYVTGYSIGSGPSYDYATIKYASNGDTLWVRRYNGPGNYVDQALALALDGSGNLYVTGNSDGSGTAADYATIKYAPNGDTLWVRRYNGPGNQGDQALALALDASGNLYVTGRSIGSGTDYDYATIKYVQTPPHPGVRLTSIDKKSPSQTTFTSSNPNSFDSVEVGSHIKFIGIAVAADSTPLVNQPIYVYNSFKFNPSYSIVGIDTILTNSVGVFVYPPVDTGLFCSREGFWPFWFAANDSEAVPFLLTVGNGCHSCAIDSIVAALDADTSGLFDAVAVVNDSTDPLFFPIYNYPANDSNLVDPVNDRFWAVYSQKYFGPLRYSFLMNSVRNGWLQAGDSLVDSRLENVAQDLPNYFRTLSQRVQVIAERTPASSNWHAVSMLTSTENTAFAENFRWIVSNTKKSLKSIRNWAWNFGVDNWDLLVCGGTCLAGLGVNECRDLALGVAKKIGSKVISAAASRLVCTGPRSTASCRATTTKVVDGAFLFANAVYKQTEFAGSICGVAGAVNGLLHTISVSEQCLTADGQTQIKLVSAADKLKYQSEQRTDVQQIENCNSSISARYAQLSDTSRLDLYFTMTDPPAFRISASLDNEINPQSLSLTITSSKILFAPNDTIETLAGLAVVNVADTVNIVVARIDDSTYSATIPLSAMPNYNPGQKYTAALIASGQDLFSNYGEQKDDHIHLATVTIDGDSLIAENNSGLIIPQGALNSPTFVTIIPGTFPSSNQLYNLQSLSTPSESLHFIGDLTQITPDRLELNLTAQLILPIDTAEFNSILDSTLAVVQYDSVTNGWVNIGGIISQDGLLISTQINQFGLFGVVTSPKCIAKPGDAAANNIVNLADIIFLVNSVFKGGPKPNPICRGDATGNGTMNLADIIYLVNYIFKGGPKPVKSGVCCL